jgi:sugar/nucleoside kinase (ribokinase family)
VTVDLACGTPAFLDLTFAGLEALPAAGEERFAQALLRSPGGGASTAIGAARLGLDVVHAAPLGRDPEGAFVRAALEAEGVRVIERTIASTPVTAVLPVGGDRAMATYAPDDDLRTADLAACDPRAVILSLQRADRAPAGAALYATAGDDDARAFAGALPPAVAGAHALLLNEREARLLAGAGVQDVVTAARTLAAQTAATVVVTRGPAGALAVADGVLTEVPGFEVEAADTTGAGDLFAAAYLWADLGGAPPADRLSWACLYAALSVRVRTAVAGALTIVALAEAGAEHGLALPAFHSRVEEEGRT